MRQRVIGLGLLVLAVFLAGVRLASAQDPVTVSANYDFVYHEFQDTSAAGVHIDVAKPFAMLSGVGEIGFNHFEGATISSFMAGGRWALPRGTSSKIEPSVQVLLGAWHCCGETDLAIQPGLLVDYPYSMKVKIRGQVDLRHIFFDDFEDENAFRLSGGIVVNLDQK